MNRRRIAAVTATAAVIVVREVPATAVPVPPDAWTPLAGVLLILLAAVTAVATVAVARRHRNHHHHYCTTPAREGAPS